MQDRVNLYPPFEPYRLGMLQVSMIHTVHYELSGNNRGKPVLILHGGPGGGISAMSRRFFDKETYMIIQFDQRGCGNSLPSGSIEENSTQDLIEDIEKIRDMLNIEKFHTVFGGSWGSTLSLAYAEAHPERVGHLVLRGIFLLRKSEINFFYQEGTNWFFPDYHEELKNMLPEVERGNILYNYYRRLTGNDEEEKKKFAKAWTKYEMSTLNFFVDKKSINKIGNDDDFNCILARLETSYFVNGGFFRCENQILDDAYKIENIPTIIIQGRYDMICPVKSAYDLSKKLKNCELKIIPDAGHSSDEPGIIDGLVRATNKFKLED